MVGTLVSEGVGIGHPDKIADYIADYLVDNLRLVDEKSRCAFEVLCTEKVICLGGEYHCRVDLKRRYFTDKIKDALMDIYPGRITSHYEIFINLNFQSLEIIEACIQKDFLCPDQGVAYGYAEFGTPNMLPLTQEAVITLNKALADETEHSPNLGNDYKMLITAENGRLRSVKLSILHNSSFGLTKLRNYLEPKIRNWLLEGSFKFHDDFVLAINPGGSFTIGGLSADSGTTNRKLMCDSYGCDVKHGGGGYAGKDLSKPDRLLAYWARYIAKNAVASGYCAVCKIKLIYSYASEFVDVVEVFTDVNDVVLHGVIKAIMKWPYSSIYHKFSSYDSFSQLSRFGQFSDFNAPWEALDLAEQIADMMRNVSNKKIERYFTSLPF